MVKQQLERRFGSEAANQKLELHSASGEVICQLADDNMTLEQYKVQESQVIHCIDTNPSMNYAEFEDLSKVEKYEMSDKEYDKRDDTFRKFRQQQLKANPNFKSYIG